VSEEANEDEALVPRFARPHLRAGDATGWFEPVYAAAGENVTDVPWVDLEPNRHLLEWLERENVDGAGRRTAVVGCGLGDDANLLHEHGFDAIGFDISPTAIARARTRFPETRFEVADLLALPEDQPGSFAFVFEAYTLQALPQEIRTEAIDAVASLLAAGGTLLVVTFGRTEDEDPGRLPWPLTRTDLARCTSRGLREVQFEEYRDELESVKTCFRVQYMRDA
jgi:ubiquinone/menaquinone biosynthesis C-methylase UbiE